VGAGSGRIEPVPPKDGGLKPHLLSGYLGRKGKEGESGKEEEEEEEEVEEGGRSKSQREGGRKRRGKKSWRTDEQMKG